MTECIIIFRNTMNKLIGFVSFEDPDHVAVFKNRDEAETMASEVLICRAHPYQIVELDGL